MSNTSRLSEKQKRIILSSIQKDIKDLVDVWIKLGGDIDKIGLKIKEREDISTHEIVARDMERDISSGNPVFASLVNKQAIIDIDNGAAINE